MRKLVVAALVFAPTVALGQTVESIIGEGGQWDELAVAPDGADVWAVEFAGEVARIDVATDTVQTFSLTDYLGGVGISAGGRVLVIGEAEIVELDRATGMVVQRTAAPRQLYSEGPVVFAPAGDRAYVAANEDIYVLQLDPLEVVDLNAGDPELTGLLGVNSAWSGDWHRARDLHISPDGDRLYVMGDEIVDGLALSTIDGLAGIADHRNLTLTTYERTSANESFAEDTVLTEDGALLFDLHGNVWDTATMQVLETIDFGFWPSFEPTMLARAPDGSNLYVAGLASTDDGGSLTGNQVLVFDGATLAPIDLDGDSSNGVTGFPLPGDFGYNGSRMRITPDGAKLYMAVGGDGLLVATLGGQIASGGVRPDRGGDDGEVTVRISGQFDEGTAVRLERAGQPAVPGAETLVLPSRALQTRFDLHGVALGPYDVVIVPPGGPEERRLEAFTVEPAVEGATFDVIGSTQFLAVGEAEVRIVVQNTGNVDLTELVLTLGLSAGTRYKVRLPSAPGFPGGEQLDPEFLVADPEAPELIWFTRLIPGGEYAFFLIVAGPSGTPPMDWDIELQATLGYLEPALGGPQPILGELCSIGSAVVTAVNSEVERQGGDASNLDTDRILLDAAKNYAAAKITDLARVAVGTVLGGPAGGAGAKIYNDLTSCFDFITGLFSFSAMFSYDPNDKLGTTGVDGYIVGDEALRYTIRFENEAEASAPAQTVVIEDILDDNLDLSTLEVTYSSHPGVLDWSVDPTTRNLTFTFSNIDLPPNVSPPEGEGFVEYTIRARPGLPSGTIIENAADIIFDLNDPIVTPVVTHEVDTEAPDSAVLGLPTTVPPRFDVQWLASDEGVGAWQYSVFVSVDGAGFMTWLDGTTATSETFTGEVGKTYRFYSVARDRLGNLEAADEASAVATTVSEDGDGGGGCGCCARAIEGSRGMEPTWAALALLLAARTRRGRRPTELRGEPRP